MELDEDDYDFYLKASDSDNEETLAGSDLNAGSDSKINRGETEDNDTSESNYFSFKVLTADEIGELMKRSIDETNSVIQLPSLSVTRLLLSHFHWDQTKLMDAYFGSGDHGDLLKKIGLKSWPESKNTQLVSRIVRNVDEENCEICCSPIRLSNMFDMSCGHRYCLTCWNKYLTEKIIGAGQVGSIACPSYNCSTLVDDAVVLKILESKEVKIRFQKAICDNFVQCNKSLRWCPAPECTNAVLAEYSKLEAVSCSCGFGFCFRCGLEAHAPVGCQLLTQWLKKCSDDSETIHYLHINTKECPNCHVAIEKNAGCNHMRCRKCSYEFCWVCMQDWRKHGYEDNRCNRYNESPDGQAGANSLKKSKEALARYLFYCNRYNNHQRSLKLEKDLREKVASDIEALMIETNTRWFDLQFVTKAVDVLSQCRKTLMYSYAFAFYMKKNNQMHIFEDNQHDLEVAVEGLSDYLDRRISSERLPDITIKVHDKASYCEGRGKVLLEHVREGYDMGWWCLRTDS